MEVGRYASSYVGIQVGLEGSGLRAMFVPVGPDVTTSSACRHFTTSGSENFLPCPKLPCPTIPYPFDTMWYAGYQYLWRPSDLLSRIYQNKIQANVYWNFKIMNEFKHEIFSMDLRDIFICINFTLFIDIRRVVNFKTINRNSKYWIAIYVHGFKFSLWMEKHRITFSTSLIVKILRGLIKFSSICIHFKSQIESKKLMQFF